MLPQGPLGKSKRSNQPPRIGRTCRVSILQSRSSRSFGPDRDTVCRSKSPNYKSIDRCVGLIVGDYLLQRPLVTFQGVKSPSLFVPKLSSLILILSARVMGLMVLRKVSSILVSAQNLHTRPLDVVTLSHKPRSYFKGRTASTLELYGDREIRHGVYQVNIYLTGMSRKFPIALTFQEKSPGGSASC